MLYNEADHNPVGTLAAASLPLQSFAPPATSHRIGGSGKVF